MALHSTTHLKRQTLLALHSTPSPQETDPSPQETDPSPQETDPSPEEKSYCLFPLLPPGRSLSILIASSRLPPGRSLSILIASSRLPPGRSICRPYGLFRHWIPKGGWGRPGTAWHELPGEGWGGEARHGMARAPWGGVGRGGQARHGRKHHHTQHRTHTLDGSSLGGCLAAPGLKRH